MAWAARHKALPVLAGSFSVELHIGIRPLKLRTPLGPAVLGEFGTQSSGQLLRNGWNAATDRKPRIENMQANV